MSATLSILGLYRVDQTLFNTLSVPSGIDRQSLIDELVTQCAEFEILYTDPAFIKMAIKNWSKQSLFKWQKLYDTMSLKYDPISNYDRVEEWTDTAEINPGSIEIASQQGYNETGFVDSSKMSRSGKDTSSATHKGRTSGNIGVTTSQQMLEQERKVADFNIYQIIIDDFKMRFCLMMY